MNNKIYYVLQHHDVPNVCSGYIDPMYEFVSFQRTLVLCSNALSHYFNYYTLYLMNVRIQFNTYLYYEGTCIVQKQNTTKTLSEILSNSVIIIGTRPNPINEKNKCPLLSISSIDPLGTKYAI